MGERILCTVVDTVVRAVGGPSLHLALAGAGCKSNSVAIVGHEFDGRLGKFRGVRPSIVEVPVGSDMVFVARLLLVVVTARVVALSVARASALAAARDLDSNMSSLDADARVFNPVLECLKVGCSDAVVVRVLEFVVGNVARGSQVEEVGGTATSALLTLKNSPIWPSSSVDMNSTELACLIAVSLAPG